MPKAVTLKNSSNEEIYPVTDMSLVNGLVGTSKLADNSITAVKLFNNSVSTDKVRDGAITNAKIDDATITQDKFDLDEFPAGHYGYYFTSNKTTTNASTGTELGTTQTITCSKPTRVMFEFSAFMKTSRYTSNVALKVDGTVVASSGTNSTSNMTVIGRHVMTLTAGSHTVVACIRSQDSGTTATAIAYCSETNGIAWWCV